MQKGQLKIGGKGLGKLMIVVRMNIDEYRDFRNFCRKNGYEYHTDDTIKSTKQYVDISCEKKVLEAFIF